jgi:hypothetical protein
MTTLTLSPTSRVREPLSRSPALGLPKGLASREAGADRAGLARRFLLALLHSLAAPAA